MTDKQSSLGTIHVSPRAIATIVYQAAMQSYGVVGLAAKNILDGLANTLVNDPAHGIEVSFHDDKIDIDLYVIVEYGTRIKAVAASVANTVRFRTEKALGLQVNNINVHVQGLRVSNID